VSGLRIGSGEYLFERDDDFGRDKPSFGVVSNVAIDASGRVRVWHRGVKPLVTLDDKGAPVESWGEGVARDPHGMFAVADGSMWLVDRGSHEVFCLGSDGKITRRIGTRDRPALEAPFSNPADVAISPRGEIFVADGYANSRVHRFSPTGEHILSWGGPGSLAGQFRVPHGIWIDSDETVYVADRENNRVQLFTTGGIFIDEWPDFYRPTDVFIDSEGLIYVPDHVPRLTVLDRGGRILARGMVGDRPHSVWGDKNGSIYLALALERRIEKYVRVRS
jgi:peptidylglycine monooxygenase